VVPLLFAFLQLIVHLSQLLQRVVHGTKVCLRGGAAAVDTLFC
jgi:hypothetical protein